MAYFANGTEGLYLEAQCCECLHRGNDDVMCPISAVQTLYNYDQIGNEDLTAAMNFLINEQGDCQMKKALDTLNLINSADDLTDLERWEMERDKCK